MKQERLFEAMSGVTPELLARSEQNQRPVIYWRTLAAAACLTIIISAALHFSHGSGIKMQNAETEPETSFNFNGDILCDTDVSWEKPPEEEMPPDNTASTLLNRNDVGQLHLCQLRYDCITVPDFMLNINPERFVTSEISGIYIIRPVSQPADTSPSEFPVIDFQVSHQNGVSPEQAVQNIRETLLTAYNHVSDPVETEQGLQIRAGNGNAWNDAQTEINLISDGENGSFILTARYFTEAEEGYGVWFRDMVGTFQVIPTGTQVPEWMSALRATTSRIMNALFANHPEELSDIMLPGEYVCAEAYGEDVREDVSIAAIDYIPDMDGTSHQEQSPTFATVFVKHRICTEDSFNYLAIELNYQGGQWLLQWAGLEK